MSDSELQQALDVIWAKSIESNLHRVRRLEQLGEDLVPRVWQQQGVIGVIQLFGDLVLRLPCEHFSTWADRLREATMADDVFEGTWRARRSGPFNVCDGCAMR